MPDNSVGATPRDRKRAMREAVEVAVLNWQIWAHNRRAVGISDPQEADRDRATFWRDLAALDLSDYETQICKDLFLMLVHSAGERLRHVKLTGFEDTRPCAEGGCDCEDDNR